MFDISEIKARMNAILAEHFDDLAIVFEDVEQLDEVAMKRVIRKGKIVRKVKTKKAGYKVLRTGNTVKFVRMTQKEKRGRRKAARKAWRTGKGSRKNMSKRSLVKSKVRMKQLYGK